jgi:beta-glucosidase
MRQERKWETRRPS